jgi:hypothetical protein
VFYSYLEFRTMHKVHKPSDSNTLIIFKNVLSKYIINLHLYYSYLYFVYFLFILFLYLLYLCLQIQGSRVRFPGTTTNKKVVGLERGPLSLVSTTEELLDRKVAAPV